MNKVIGLVNREKIVCIGTKESCERYINQLYSINLNQVNFIEYNYYFEDYDDYEVIYVPEENIYLLMGIAKLLQNSCKEDQSSIQYMRNEIDILMNSDIFIQHQDLIEEMKYMKDILEKMNKIQIKYIQENLFYNLDIDALHSAFLMERENKGLPISYYKRTYQ